LKSKIVPIQPSEMGMCNTMRERCHQGDQAWEQLVSGSSVHEGKKEKEKEGLGDGAKFYRQLAALRREQPVCNHARRLGRFCQIAVANWRVAN
jgi:hypothetical protein